MYLRYVKNSITARSQMFFVTIENEPSIFNLIQRKTLCLPIRTPRQTKAKRTTKKLGEIPLQCHTDCARYFRRGFTFQAPFLGTNLF